MFAGLDVRDSVDPVQQIKTNSNVMSVGYEDGPRLGIGCQGPDLGIEAFNKVESAVEILTAAPRSFDWRTALGSPVRPF